MSKTTRGEGKMCGRGKTGVGDLITRWARKLRKKSYGEKGGGTKITPIKARAKLQ